jgi:hypothetical protein
MPDLTPNEPTVSRSAEAAAIRFSERNPDEDIKLGAAPSVSEPEGIVANRHSASAEAAALRYLEKQEDVDV